MPDPAWPCSPPEVNYLRLTGNGAGGTATTISSGVAWQTLVGCSELAHSLSTLNTAVTALNFDGVGGTSSAAAVTGLNTALQLLADWAQEKPPIVASAVAAYETAVSAMIPAEISVANRTEQAANTALNPLVFGALTPAIVTLDAVYYGEHWAQNAGAGVAYGAALSGLMSALAVPPPSAPAAAPAVGIPTAPPAEAAAPAQAARESLSPAESPMQPMQAALGVMQSASGMFTGPPQAAQGISGLPQSMMGPLGAMAGVPGESAARTALPPATVNPAAGSIGGTSAGGYPGAGTTSYTRPTSSFSPEVAGRPTSLNPGLLSRAEFRGPTTSGSAGAAGAVMPMSAGHAGMLGRQRSGDAGNSVSHARVAVTGDQMDGHRPS